MKIAICFSGHFRTFKENFPNYLDNLLSQKEHQFDIFIHCWDKLDHFDPVCISVIPMAREAYKMYKPVEMVLEEVIKFSATERMLKQNANKRNISGVLGMFYKVKACNELKSAYENKFKFKYDCVIRTRPDIKLRGKVNLNVDMNQLHIPQWGDYSGLNDQFAFSSSENMNKYCSTFDQIERYIDGGMIVNPEFFVEQNVIDHGLKLQRPYIPYFIKWLNGMELDNEERAKTWVDIK